MSMRALWNKCKPYIYSNMIRTPRFGEKTNKNSCKIFKTSPPKFISYPTSILESRIIIFSQHAVKFIFELSLKLYKDAYFYTSLGLAGFSTFFCVNWIFFHLLQKEGKPGRKTGPFSFRTATHRNRNVAWDELRQLAAFLYTYWWYICHKTASYVGIWSFWKIYTEFIR